MSVPAWVTDAIFYQIFPDRFENGDPGNDPSNKVAWDALPTPYTFFGGDLQGIIQRLDHLTELGINAIYLNPIFQSPSTHRYNATDYFKIDRKLGDIHDWQALVKAAHKRDIRIILDGVFNHCGRGFFAFDDVLENREHSPYKEWFHILHFPVDAYSPGDARNYIGWWKHKSLPKLNTSNPEVRAYVLDVARYWIEQGADGWRLDVPNEIDDDSFWAEFRRVVLAANPLAYLVGEIWDVVPRWVGENHFDGLTNYPLRSAVLELLQGKMKASLFAERVERLLTVYAQENIYAQFNSLGTHDTERVLTILGRNVNKVKLAFSFLFAYPGIPSIYYGDEIGLEGHKDPDCRRAFPWDRTRWNMELFDHVKQLSRLRAHYLALRRGTLQRVLASDNQNCYAFTRSLDGEQIVIAINASGSKQSLALPAAELGWQDGQKIVDLLGSGANNVFERQLIVKLMPHSAAWLIA